MCLPKKKTHKIIDTLMFVLNLQVPFWQAEVHLPLSLVKLQVLLHPFRDIGSMGSKSMKLKVKETVHWN